MPAATSEPKVSTRTISVIGSESVPALPRSSVVRRHDALLRARVAELADREARMGALCGGDRGEDRVDLVDRLVLGAADGDSTSAERPFFEIWPALPGSSGERTSRTSATLETRATTSAIAESKAGVPTRSERLWIRTRSVAGRLNPASRILSMRPDSPGPALVSMFLVPTMPPSRRRRGRTRSSRRSPSSSARRSSGPCGRRGCGAAPSGPRRCGSCCGT